VADFLAGRVPCRKNFAGSLRKSLIYPVKQGFSCATTYSQTSGELKMPVEFLPRCSN
jgi:hypothetical protein